MLVRRGFEALITSEEDLEVVGEAETGSQAIDQALKKLYERIDITWQRRNQFK